MTRLTVTRIAWLAMAAACIGAGINAIVREGLVVAVVLGAAAVGLLAAVLIPGAIARWAATSHAKSTAADKQLLARIAAQVEAAETQRKELTR